MTTTPYYPPTPRQPSPTADRLAATMTEAQLLNLVRSLASLLGWRGYHTHRSDRSEPGFPDLVLVRGDRVVWRELKTSTGRMRPAQQQWLDDLVAAGQDAMVWRPADWSSGAIEADLRARAPAR